MESNYIMRHVDGSTSVFTRSQIIENARQQKARGWEPSYRRVYGENDYSAPGYLVFSGMDGCCVCRLNDDGSVFIMTGWQGDFVLRSA